MGSSRYVVRRVLDGARPAVQAARPIGTISRPRPATASATTQMFVADRPQRSPMVCHASAGGVRLYATHSTCTDPTHSHSHSHSHAQTHPHGLTPDMDSTLARLLPPAAASHLPIPVALAQRIVSDVLLQLRAAPALATTSAKVAAQAATDARIQSQLIDAHHPATDLTALATFVLLASQDPRRQPVAFRLFEVAYGAPTRAAFATLSAEEKHAAREEARLRTRTDGAAREEQLTPSGWWDDEAGCSWAGMVLSNTAPPPADADVRARYAEAVETYRRLAERGSAAGKLGLGRLLLGKVAEGKLDPVTRGRVVERFVQLWREAGQAGNGEAWYELGTVYLGGQHVALDEGAARDYFHKGAELDHAGSHYALGVTYTRLAPSLSDTERPATQRLAHTHFRRAAAKGDVQAMYNVGVHLLLQPSSLLASPASQSGDKTLKQLHLDRWGVEPDDVEARVWFERAAARHFAPALMNLAAVLVEGRGNPAAPAQEAADSAEQKQQQQQQQQPQAAGLDADPHQSATFLTRLQSLRYAQALYAKVVSMGSVSSSLPGGGEQGLARFGLDRESAEQMVKLANEQMDKVKVLVEEEEKRVGDDGKAPP